MKKFIHIFFLTLFFTLTLLGQRTDLSGIKICIDPGHGGHNAANDRHLIPDPGTDFWESESNLYKAFWLKPMLEAKGAWVILTRYTNDYPNDDEPNLSARVALGNANNVHWFHSIHSNATGSATNPSTNFTLMLVREKRSNTDPAASSGNGMGIPEQQESWTMTNITGNNIKTNNRTSKTVSYLDWTFYGGTNGGFSLGVLRGLLMPGQLSEGSFHDHYPETRRLMNNEYRKMEAYALRNSFTDYYQIPRDTLCNIAGIIKDEINTLPVNQVTVTLLPLNKTYVCDIYNNGYYLFDSLAAGTYTIKYEKPGYIKDSAVITVSRGNNFVDKILANSASPVITSSTLKDGDTLVSATSAWKIIFSKPMDTASVRSATSFSPEVECKLSWQNSNKDLSITPVKPLTSNTNYIFKIDTSAKDYKGFSIDGNGDAIPGDPVIINFRTLTLDAEFPYILSTYPTINFQDFSNHGIITILFNKKMDTSSIVNGGVVLRKYSTNVPAIFSFSEVNEKTVLSIKPVAPFDKLSQYVVIAYTTVKDIYQNSMKSITYFYFYTSDRTYKSIQTLESFSAGTGNWKAPTYSGSTTGVVPDSTSQAEDNSIYFPGTDDKKSMKLTYTWNVPSSTYLLREYLSTGLPYTTQFDTSVVLQTYIFGDGSKNKIRLCVDDSSTLTLHKVNNWITIDWIGWRLIEWKLTNPNELGSWLNAGVIKGPKNRVDSYQMTYNPEGGARTGSIYIDELRIAEIGTPVKVEKLSAIPQEYLLKQNYPNPFNPSTNIVYSLPQGGFVNLKIYDILGKEITTLINENQESGTYTISWNASSEPNGVYFARLNAGGKIYSIKMMLLK